MKLDGLEISINLDFISDGNWFIDVNAAETQGSSYHYE